MALKPIKPRVMKVRKTAGKPEKQSLFGGFLSAAGVGKSHLRQLQGFKPVNFRKGLRPVKPVPVRKMIAKRTVKRKQL